MKFKEKTPPPRGEIGPRINFISKRFRQRFNEVAKDFDLFSGQQNIIMALHCHPGMTVSELAKNTKVSNASISVSIKRMEKSGFITKKESENDARVVRLYLTEKADALPDEICQKMAEQEKIFTSNLTEDEIYQLSDLLDKISNNIISQEEKAND